MIDRIYDSLYRIPTIDGLLPTNLSPRSGESRGGALTMGAMADSYYEYLLKMWIQGGKKDEVGDLKNILQITFHHSLFETPTLSLKLSL